MKLQLLLKKMEEKNVSKEELASMINVDKATIYRRLKRSDPFSIREASIIKKKLELSDEEATQIFLR